MREQEETTNGRATEQGEAEVRANPHQASRLFRPFSNWARLISYLYGLSLTQITVHIRTEGSRNLNYFFFHVQLFGFAAASLEKKFFSKNFLPK